MSLLGGHRVFFEYSTETITAHENKKKIKVTRPVTKCVIKKEDEEIASSEVRLHHRDIANRVKAREYAFTNAVEKIENRETRKAIHSDFRSQIKWR